MTPSDHTPALTSTQTPEQARDELNRIAVDTAKHMREQDPRLKDDLYGPFTDRLQELQDMGKPVVLVDSFIHTLRMRREIYLDELAKLRDPDMPLQDEITKRAGVVLMLTAIAKTLDALK
jgi:hypothetical protein